MEEVIKGFVVLITNLNLEFFSLQIFNVEGRNLEFLVEKLELALPQDIGVVVHNLLGGKKGNFYYNLRLKS